MTEVEPQRGADVCPLAENLEDLAWRHLRVYVNQAVERELDWGIQGPADPDFKRLTMVIRSRSLRALETFLSKSGGYFPFSNEVRYAIEMITESRKEVA